MLEAEKTKERNYEEIYRAVKEDDREKFRHLFLKLHTRDQTELFHLLYPEKKKKIADFIEPDEFAALFEWMDQEDQEEAAEYLPAEYMARAFNEMAADNVSHFLSQLDEPAQRPFLAMMDKEARQDVEELLSYTPRTAGSIMTKEFIYLTVNQTVEEVLKQLRQVGKDAETIYYMYVVDEEMLLKGVLSLRDLILSEADEKIDNLMSTHVVSVPITEDQEDVARVIQEYDLLAVPVVQMDGEVVGIVTVDDVMDVLEAEVTEDFQEFSAIKPSDQEEMTIFQTAKARIPWIVILIFLGLITAGLISFFEETLQSVVALAAFIPIIMDSAGNVGTQSLAVAVRELSLEDGRKKGVLKDTIKRELGSGFLIGVAAMITIMILVIVLYQNVLLSLVIGVSMLITLSVSSVVGAIVPIIATKLNIDPAIASGPFITTINDAMGLFIYFSMASFLLEHL